MPPPSTVTPRSPLPIGSPATSPRTVAPRGDITLCAERAQLPSCFAPQSSACVAGDYYRSRRLGGADRAGLHARGLTAGRVLGPRIPLRRAGRHPGCTFLAAHSYSVARSPDRAS